MIPRQKAPPKMTYELIESIAYTFDEVLEAFDLESNPKIFDRVDNIIINNPESHFHLGKICYLNFKMKKCVITKKTNKFYAVPSTLSQERIQVVKLLLKYIHSLVEDGIRQFTISTRLSLFNRFFSFLNENNIPFTKQVPSVQNALVKYSEHLKHRIKIYNKELKIGLCTSTASNYQVWLLSFCSFYIHRERYQLLSAHHLIANNTKECIPTQPLPEETQIIEFNQYTSIFRKFSSIVLEHETLPQVYELHNQSYWLISENRILHTSDNRLTKAKANSKEKTVNSAHSNFRIFLAICACKSYFMHFLFLTGENDSCAARIILNEDYTLENSNLNFKTIKWRAKGVTVTFDIQSEFYEDFKTFLLIRKYLIKLHNINHNKLFLNRVNYKLVPPPTRGDFSVKIKSHISNIFKKNNFSATSRKIRVSKGIWIREKYGSTVSSYILQHSKKTSETNYTGISSAKSSEELTQYFDTITNQLLPPARVETESKTPSGSCIEQGTPSPISHAAIKKPSTIDCSDLKSCLFCSKYKVHSDEVDIRKLISMKYIIVQSEHLATSIEHYNRIYKPSLAHIDELLKRIKAQGEKQAKLISNIHKQVFEEEILSKYWYRKLELLNELGII